MGMQRVAPFSVRLMQAGPVSYTHLFQRLSWGDFLSIIRPNKKVRPCEQPHLQGRESKGAPLLPVSYTHLTLAAAMDFVVGDRNYPLSELFMKGGFIMWPLLLL